MQRVTLVRYTTKPDRAAENEALSRAVFTQLHSAPPAGIAYALFRDGNEFVHVFESQEALNRRAAKRRRLLVFPSRPAIEGLFGARYDVKQSAG